VKFKKEQDHIRNKDRHQSYGDFTVKALHTKYGV